MNKIQELAGKHKGETCHIIGKGPSLINLKEWHIGKGIVITLNHAIIKVESLKLNNVVYSMQKDGWPKLPNNCPSLKCDACVHSVRPKSAILLLHILESIQCHPDYPNRYFFNNLDFKLSRNNCSVLVALNIGRLFGCNDFKLVSFDAITRADNRTYTPNIGITNESNYIKDQSTAVLKYLIYNNFKWEFITPE